MKKFEVMVYVQNGNTRVPHVTHVQAESSFSAREMLSAQYGRENVISVPTEVKNNSSGHNSAPWMLDIGKNR